MEHIHFQGLNGNLRNEVTVIHEVKLGADFIPPVNHVAHFTNIDVKNLPAEVQEEIYGEIPDLRADGYVIIQDTIDSVSILEDGVTVQMYIKRKVFDAA